MLFRLFYIIILVSFTIVPQNAEVGLFGCDRSWMRAGHKCYYFESSYKATWSDGRQTCLEVGADFLKTETPDEAVSPFFFK